VIVFKDNPGTDAVLDAAEKCLFGFRAVVALFVV
jgi:hypothetical protein